MIVLNIEHAAGAQSAFVQRQGNEFESPFLHHATHTKRENRGAIGTQHAFAFYGVSLEPLGELELHRNLRIVRIRRLDPHRHKAFDGNARPDVFHGVTEIHRNARHRRHRHLLIALDGIGEAIHHRLIHRDALTGDHESRLYHRGALLLLLRLGAGVDRRLKPILLFATEGAPPR